MKKRGIILLTAVLLLSSLFSSAFAANETSTVNVYKPQQLNRVQLGNGSYASLSHAAIMPSNSGQKLAITIELFNGSSTDLNTVDYWIRVRSANNSSDRYSVKLIPADADKSRIPAKTSTTLTYHSNVGADFKLSNMVVEVIKWDFSVDSFERVLGQFRVTSDLFLVPANHEYTVHFSGMNMSTNVVKSVISKNQKYYNSTIYFKFVNKGKSAVAIPDLRYYILTSEGILYNLKSNIGNQLSIDPMMDKEVILRGSIPIEIKESGWKLVLAMPIGDGKEVIPISQYTLPKSTQESGYDFDKEYSFTTIDGLYNVKVDSVTRTPLEDQDIVSASIKISNKGELPLPVPNLAGLFTLDDAIERDATVILPDKVIAIQPNSEITAHMYSTIPYTYDFEQLKLTLQEKNESSEKSTLLEITGMDVFSPLQQVLAGQSYNIDIVGTSSEYKVRDVRTYEGTGSSIFSIQLDVSNKEKRPSDVMAFSAHMKTADGYMFPAEVSEINNKMIPGGKALLQVTSIIPEGYDMEGARLVLGETVPGTGDSNQTTKTAVAPYVNPVEYVLLAEKPVLKDIKGIDFYPYKLSIEKVKSQIIYGENKIKLDFKYTLERDSLVQANLENRKVVLEIKDTKNDISFSNEYSFEEDSDQSFKLGTHSGTFSAVDEDLVFKIQTMNNNYQINVYEQIAPGYKKMLASKEIRWFTTSD